MHSWKFCRGVSPALRGPSLALVALAGSSAPCRAELGPARVLEWQGISDCKFQLNTSAFGLPNVARTIKMPPPGCV